MSGGEPLRRDFRRNRAPQKQHVMGGPGRSSAIAPRLEESFMQRTLPLHASPWWVLCSLVMSITAPLAHAAAFGPGFAVHPVTIDGGTVSVTVGGSGPPVLLLHGYAETSRMWKPLAIV